MRQKWKIHINFGIFKSKRLEWVWRVLVWEKSKNFIQQEVTKWRKIRHKNLPKRSDLLSKGDFVRRLPWSPDDFLEVQTTSWKSRRLPGSPDDFLEVQTTLSEDFQEVQTTSRWLTGKSSKKSSRSEKPAYQIQIWKTCISKNVQMT